jgi:hypothetical protein
MRTAAFIFLLVCVPAYVLALGNNQLYTGTPATVPAGRTQLQLYADRTASGESRIGGIEFTRGVTSNVEVKLANSNVWNAQGPNVQIGPNVGIKWRFAGDGLAKPSLAVSALWVSQSVGGRSTKPDYASALIGSYPTRYCEFLANYGHEWIGDNIPDLQFVGLAAVRPTSKMALVALEYSSLTRTRGNGPPSIGRQVAAGLVYGKRLGWSYSLQAGYLFDTPRTRWHTTLGVATYF